eukprot:304383-Prorocentrum_lima.AAC.1
MDGASECEGVNCSLAQPTFTNKRYQPPPLPSSFIQGKRANGLFEVDCARPCLLCVGHVLHH